MTTGTVGWLGKNHSNSTKYISYSAFIRSYSNQEPSVRDERLKRVLGVIVGLALLVGAVAIISTKLATLGEIRVEKVQQYTVHSGDTLWNIASIADPKKQYDSRDVVELMEKWNGITNDQELQPGTVITLPICSSN